MTSPPADPRPDPFNEFGGGQSRTLAEGRIPAPKPEVLAAEKDAFRTLATQTSAPILEVKHQLLHPGRRGDCMYNMWAYKRCSVQFCSSSIHCAFFCRCGVSADRHLHEQVSLTNMMR